MNRHLFFHSNLAETNANKPGRQFYVELREKREAFYKDNLDRLMINGKLAPLNSDVYNELSILCECTVRAAYLAVSRYVKNNQLIAAIDRQSESEDDEYTAFGEISHKGEVFDVNISGMALFNEDGRTELRKKNDFCNDLVLLIYKTTRKPCC